MSTLQRTRRTPQNSDQFSRAKSEAVGDNPIFPISNFHIEAQTKASGLPRPLQTKHVLSTGGPQPDEVAFAVVDRGGVVVSVNIQWSQLCQRRDAPFSLTVGETALDESDSVPDANVQTLIARAVRSALAGELLLPVTVQIPSKAPAGLCHPEVAVWSRLDERCLCVGAMVVYYERTDLVMPGITTHLSATLDAAKCKFAATNPCTTRFSRITPAEWRVLRELATHRTIKAIAARLSVSPHTVKTQVTSIYEKLGVAHRSDAVDLLYDALRMNGSGGMASAG